MLLEFSRNQCQEAGIISKRVPRKPQFNRKHAPSLMKCQDTIYLYFTDCWNGLQLDCFDTQFAESKRKWERILASGLVHPRGLIVSDSSPTARKYDKEKYTMNVEEEDGLVDDLARTQDWEHDASVAMDGCYVALWKSRRNRKFTRIQVRALEIRLKKAREKVANCIGLVANCKGQLRDVGLVGKLSIIFGMQSLQLQIL